jgi:hypothetical protein
LYPDSSGFLDPAMEAHRALGAADDRAFVEDELAADRALE